MVGYERISMNIRKKIVIAVGCRPNFMKVALLYPMLKKDYDVKVIHTGQHNDLNMSFDFATEFGFEIDCVLSYKGLWSIGPQFSYALSEYKPDLAIVVGDVYSTTMCALAAKYVGIEVAHIEAGMRSYDLNQPEEINRCAVDAISDYNFCIRDNYEICKEGEGWHTVGNTMIDLLKKYTKNIDSIYDKNYKYCLVTIHRRENLTRENLTKVVDILNKVHEKIDILFPIHPHTQKKLNEYKLKLNFGTDKPMGYKEFVQCMKFAKFVITDSGGSQAECDALAVPCFIMRERTEHSGNMKLVGLEEKRLFSLIKNIGMDTFVPPHEDGKASERIYKIIKEIL